MDKHKLPWWIKIPYEIKRWLFTWNIRFIPHLFKKYGSIEFVEGNFSKLDYYNNHFDCVVSTSAIEHNKHLSDVGKTIREMNRVLKPHRPMLVTSAASPSKTFFLKDVYCWCFSWQTLENMFKIYKYNNYDQFDRIYNNNINDPYIGKIVRKRFKGRLPEYISVGIEKWK
jgi:ubiquinone/menaquinone biosynthesis C-methylase UbiE